MNREERRRAERLRRKNPPAYAEIMDLERMIGENERVVATLRQAESRIARAYEGKREPERKV